MPEKDVMVNINNVIQILINEHILKGDKILLGTTPRHGSCCICQECGQVYDDCISFLQSSHLVINIFPNDP